MRIASVLLAGAFALSGCGQPEQRADSTRDAAAPTAATAPTAPPPAAQPTAAMGEQIFRRCVACHTIDAGGGNGIGPNLHGIVGRAVASHPGFAYSAALKAKGGTWDDAALDSFLESPMKAVPGTRMTFAGVIDPLDRQALILYLGQQSR